MDIFSFVKSKISILEVVREYVSLKPAGQYWKGHSPFKNERTPSFTVSPEKEIFYCFSTHIGGDVIRFIQEVEQCSPIEAVNHLVERYSLQVPEHITQKKMQSSGSHDIKKKYYHLCSLFAQWLHHNLQKSTKARRYCSERSITQQSISQYTLGYFPATPQARNDLLATIQKHGFMAQDLLDAHIMLQKNGRLFSPFEERIIFPIANHLGNFCAFGGRVFLPNDSRAKYYNSREHDYFNKRTILYGLSVAKKAIQEKQAVFLVEGYTDCVAMAQAGYTHTVATLGTACTHQHLSTLARYAQTVYVLYDSDQAGKNAALRLTQLCWDVNLELRIINLPKGHDPASFFTQYSHEEFETLVAQSCDIFGFFISTLGKDFQKQSLQKKLQVMDQITQLVAKIEDPLKQDVLLQQAAQTCAIPFATLKKSLYKKSLKPAPQQPTVQQKNVNSIQEIPTLERELFSAILCSMDSVDSESLIFLQKHVTPPLAAILQKILTCIQQRGVCDIHGLLPYIDQQEQTLVSSLAIKTQATASFDEVLTLFLKKRWKIIIKQAQQKIAHAQKTNDLNTIQMTIEDIKKLKQKMAQRGLV